MGDDTKDKIKKMIKEYVKLFPDEYKLFIDSVRAKQQEKDTKFAEAKGSEVIDRHLFDMPESLFIALKKIMTDEEWEWLFANGQYAKDYRGIKWFMRTFKQFNISEDF